MGSGLEKSFHRAFLLFYKVSPTLDEFATATGLNDAGKNTFEPILTKMKNLDVDGALQDLGVSNNERDETKYFFGKLVTTHFI